MRHARGEDLDRIEDLLADLRRFPELRERKRGQFSMGSRAFLHFHEDAGDIYVDVRFDHDFQRLRVATPGERATLLSRIQDAL